MCYVYGFILKAEKSVTWFASLYCIILGQELFPFKFLKLLNHCLLTSSVASKMFDASLVLFWGVGVGGILFPSILSIIGRVGIVVVGNLLLFLEFLWYQTERVHLPGTGRSKH